MRNRTGNWRMNHRLTEVSLFFKSSLFFFKLNHVRRNTAIIFREQRLVQFESMWGIGCDVHFLYESMRCLQRAASLSLRTAAGV
jgi:hypothetical protein